MIFILAVLSLIAGTIKTVATYPAKKELIIAEFFGCTIGTFAFLLVLSVLGV